MNHLRQSDVKNTTTGGRVLKTMRISERISCGQRKTRVLCGNVILYTCVSGTKSFKVQSVIWGQFSCFKLWKVRLWGLNANIK